MRKSSKGKINSQDLWKQTEEPNIITLLQCIPHKQRMQFLESVFGDTDEETVQEIEGCLKVYEDCNGSIYQAADALYIHKNTMQYRLCKVKKVTGFDPRVLSEAVPLYIALILSGLEDVKNC